jgi:hypothetical protein
LWAEGEVEGRSGVGLSITVTVLVLSGPPPAKWAARALQGQHDLHGGPAQPAGACTSPGPVRPVRQRVQRLGERGQGPAELTGRWRASCSSTIGPRLPGAGGGLADP